MNSQNFQLFRLTVHPTAPLFPPQAPKSEILRAAIASQPSGKRTLAKWRVANVEEVEDNALHFRFGREGKRSLPLTSPTGDFVERQVPITPFVDVVVDVSLELCAISDRADLGLRASGTALKLAAVLTESSQASVQNVSFAAAPIKEPRAFLERVRSAEAIYELWVTTNRPNPFDAEEQFVKPTAKAVEQIGGRAGKDDVHGKEDRW